MNKGPVRLVNNPENHILFMGETNSDQFIYHNPIHKLSIPYLRLSLTNFNLLEIQLPI